MKSLFFFCFFLASLFCASDLPEDASQLKSNSKIRRLYRKFLIEQAKVRLENENFLPLKSSVSEIVAWMDLSLSFFTKTVHRSFTDLESESPVVHYELPAWVNFPFLQRKLERKWLKHHGFESSFFQDEFGSTLEVKIPDPQITMILRKGHPRARVCIIVDDLGHMGKGFPVYLKMNQPVTMSFLPFYDTAVKQTEIAWNEGFEIMLHLPMMPDHSQYHKWKHLIHNGLEEGELFYHLKSAFAIIPHIQGFNNHQGSLITADSKIMNLVMKWVYQSYPDLYFVDSITSPDSLGAEFAKKYGVAFLERNSDFLDNDKNKKAIQTKIQQLIEKSYKRKFQIAITHETEISAISLYEMLTAFQEAGIELISPNDYFEAFRKKIAIDRPAEEKPQDIETYLRQ